jgi:hypothetical protein
VLHCSLCIGSTETAGVAFNGPKMTVSLHRCALIAVVSFLDTMSDFAQILAPCRANNSTHPTLHTSSSYYSAEDVCMVGLVGLRARHSANIQEKKGYFTRYRVL